MRKSFLVLLSCFLLAGLSAGTFPVKPPVTKVHIDVAPHVFQLGADQGGWVVVHAVIKYSQVDKTSVRLERVPAAFTKADNRGELVAYFSETVMKSLVAPPEARLTLVGKTTQGVKFVGSDTVKVTKHAGPQ